MYRQDRQYIAPASARGDLPSSTPLRDLLRGGVAAARHVPHNVRRPTNGIRLHRNGHFLATEDPLSLKIWARERTRDHHVELSLVTDMEAWLKR
jgi:hypothetical protein